MDPYLLSQHRELDETYWWLVARRMVIADILDRRVGTGPGQHRVLDIGCGSGSMIEVLSRFGQVTALDTSDVAAAYVRARHPEVTVVVGDIPDALPLAGGFDVITAFDVIEHITDDAAALRAIRSSLSLGGRLVCTVPAYQWLWGPHDELSQHKRRYDRRALVDVLQRAGLTVEWSSYFNTLLFPAIAALRVGRRLLRPHAAPASDFDTTVGPLNAVLLRIFAAERHLLRRVRLPFGVSVAAVARAGE